jgi:hypothetical protein
MISAQDKIVMDLLSAYCNPVKHPQYIWWFFEKAANTNTILNVTYENNLFLYYVKDAKYPWVINWSPLIFLYNEVPDSYKRGFEFLEMAAEKYPKFAKIISEPVR